MFEATRAARHSERGQLLPQRRDPPPGLAGPPLSRIQTPVCTIDSRGGQMEENRRLRDTCETRPRPVPPPGAIASASLPGYRRAGGGVGRVDPLPPTAPPRRSAAERAAGTRASWLSWFHPTRSGTTPPQGVRSKGALRGAGRVTPFAVPPHLFTRRISGSVVLALDVVDRDHAPDGTDRRERRGQQRVRRLVTRIAATRSGAPGRRSRARARGRGRPSRPSRPGRDPDDDQGGEQRQLDVGGDA